MDIDQNKEKEERIELDSLGSLEFGPEWARESADKPVSVQTSNSGPSRRPGRDPRGPGKRGKDSSGGSFRRGKPREGAKGNPGGSRPRPNPVMKGIRVSFTPERHALKVLVKLIRHNRMAYRLNELADLMMAKAEHSCMVKLETTDDKQPPFFQYQGDKVVFRDKEAALQHAFQDYLSTEFDRIEEKGEPPKGAFQFVGKCSQSGVILGPPNYHEYSLAVKKLWEERFSHQDFDQFKKNIDLVSDPELIEEWKTQSSIIEKFVRKETPPAAEEATSGQTEEPETDAGESTSEPTEEPEPETPEPTSEQTAETESEPSEPQSEGTEEVVPEIPEGDTPSSDTQGDEPQDTGPIPLTRTELEKLFREELASKKVQETRKAVIPAKSVPACDTELVRLINFVLRREQDRPVSILYALRPALKHQGVHVFKRDGEYLVNAVDPKAIDPAAAAEEWSRLLQAVQSGQAETREKITELFGESGVQTLKLLIDRGHVLELSDHKLHVVQA